MARPVLVKISNSPMSTIWTRKAVGGEFWVLCVAAALLIATLTTCVADAEWESKPVAVWDASDESSVERIDHDAWQEILTGYLRVRDSGANLFDYAALKANAEDAAKLAGYLARLRYLDPRKYARAEQQAYWINFYNALTVKIVLDAYPVDSIREIRKNWLAGLIFRGPWKDVQAKVAGLEITLDTIENGILRLIWRDNRIHYVLNCASIGCPDLAATAFTAANTDELLDAGARAYVNDSRGVDFVDDRSIVISSIYDWYAADFGDSEQAIIEHLAQYAEKPLADRLRNFSGAVAYAYDWNLNQP